ncbi:right-handed parallel beta-helix repeat-containing protein [Fontivita pretiosa]|uniref:right-handed parallel beta-helix repeat-containing protein n=1 Tax=Fontivita pretiosa TaxID=2989684 RepID=UPI003D17E652
MAGRSVVIVMICAALAGAAGPATMLPMELVGPHPRQVDLSKYARMLYVCDSSGSDAAPATADKPLKTLGAALARAGDAGPGHRVAILVAQGRYQTVALETRPEVDLYGSFAPGDWTRRDVFAHASVLDAAGQGPALLAADHSQVDGFVITAGQHDAPGGAVICRGTSPTLANCVITGNRTIHTPVVAPETLHIAGHGGGAIAILDGASPQILNNLIFDNTTDVGDGGAILVRGGSNPTISGNAIVGNESGLRDTTMYDGKVGSRSSNGGAISVSDTCAPVIADNVIALNKVHHTSDGGGIYIEYDAAPLIRGNWLVGNTTSDDGGAIYIRGMPDGSPTKGKAPLVEGNIFAGNRVYHEGRKLDDFTDAILLSKNGRATIRNNLFTGQRCGVRAYNSSARIVENVIVHNMAEGVCIDVRAANVPPSIISGNIIHANGGSPQCLVTGAAVPTPTITDNIIQGGYPGQANRDEDPGLSDDGFGATIKDRSFDAARCISILKLAEPIATDLSGRLVNVGKQWSVVRYNRGDTISVWGRIDDPDAALRVAGTFRPVRR